MKYLSDITIFGMSGRKFPYRLKKNPTITISLDEKKVPYLLLFWTGMLKHISRIIILAFSNDFMILKTDY